MNATQRENLRITLIKLSLDAAAMGIRQDLLIAYAQAAGQGNVKKEEFVSEINYLADPEKGMIAKVGKPISPENPIWRITAKGRDFAAQSGIEQD